jgi:hypothetical protein
MCAHEKFVDMLVECASCLFAPEVVAVRILCELELCRSTASRLLFLRKITTTYKFSAGQCQKLLFLFESGDERISAAVVLCPRVSDKDNMHLAISPLNVLSREELYCR